MKAVDLLAEKQPVQKGVVRSVVEAAVISFGVSKQICNVEAVEFEGSCSWSGCAGLM